MCTPAVGAVSPGPAARPVSLAPAARPACAAGQILNLFVGVLGASVHGAVGIELCRSAAVGILILDAGMYANWLPSLAEENVAWQTDRQPSREHCCVLFLATATVTNGFQVSSQSID